MHVVWAIVSTRYKLTEEVRLPLCTAKATNYQMTAVMDGSSGLPVSANFSFTRSLTPLNGHLALREYNSKSISVSYIEDTIQLRLVRLALFLQYWCFCLA